MKIQLLRQYWPKSTDLKLVADEDVAAAVTQLNQRPRIILGFKTPADLMHITRSIGRISVMYIEVEYAK